MTEQPKLRDIPDTSVVEEGEKVTVRTLAGAESTARFLEWSDKYVYNYPVDWDDDARTLDEVWSHDREVSDEDRVVEVKISGDQYAFPASKVHLKPIEDVVSGVGESKAEALYDAGFETKIALMTADQSDLADVPGIGNALAARIKADVGNLVEWADDDQQTGDGVSGVECPISNCFTKFDPDELYEHMIGTHGWYTESLENEVDTNVTD